MLHFIGDTGTMDFKMELSNEQAITAINCMKLISDGHDKEFKKELAKLTGVVSECVDAICWEAEETVKKFIMLIENGGRFAVCHGELEFGVSIDSAAATTAYKRAEF